MPLQTDLPPLASEADAAVAEAASCAAYEAKYPTPACCRDYDIVS